MKRWLLAAGVAVLAGLAFFFLRGPAPTSPAPQPPRVAAPRRAVLLPAPAPPAAGTLRGRVVTSTQAPAAGATVVARSSAASQTAQTGPDGTFQLDVAPERYLLSATAAGGASAVVGPLAVGAGQQLDVGTLELLASAGVSGVVRDATTRRPVSGATVASSGSTAKTDRAGRFSLHNLPAGETWVEASAEGYVRRLEWLTLGAAREHSGLELFLRPGATVAGTVTLEGSPVVGARVWAEVLDSAGAVGASPASVTNGEGRFLLHVEPGALALFASSPAGGRVAGPTLSVAEGDQREGLSIELAGGEAVGGLLLLNGQPFAGGQLTVLDARSQRIAALATSGADGRFSVPALSAGRYLVQAQAGAHVGQRGPYATGDAQWVVELGGDLALRGRVLPAQAGITVRWRSSDWAGGAPAQTLTDAQGAFAFEGVPSGLLMLEAEGPPGFARGRGEAGQEVVLQLGPVSLRGALFDGQGHPVTDYTVRVTALGVGPGRSVPVLSPSGDFELSLPPGDYSVGAYATGRGEAGLERVTLAAPGSSFVKLTLLPSAPVAGRVVDGQSGLPVGGAEVAVVRNRGGVQSTADRWATVTTDARGTYEVGAVPEQSGLLVRKQGFGPQWRWLPSAARSPDGRLADIALKPAAREGAFPQGYEGIGMSFDVNRRTPQVSQVFPGGTAEAAGVLVGDVVVAVDGQDAQALTADQMIARIKGPAGTVVSLTLRRNGELLTLAIRRRAIEF